MSLNYEPKLQHSKLVWTIENFRLRRRPKEFMESPIYELETWFTSKWKIVLVFNGKGGEIYLTAILKLCDISNNIEELRMRCRFSVFVRSLIHINRTRYFHVNESLIFEDFATLDDVYESIDVISDGAFSIGMEVLVKDPQPLSVPKPLIDENLLALSDDLKKLYESKNYSDLIIEACGGRMFNVHMCIFEARCLNALPLLCDDDRTIISFDFYEPYIVERLIYFMYTGDIYSVLNDPVTGISDLAKEFGMPDLELITKPKEVVVKTEIEMQKCSRIWTIQNLTEFMENRKMRATSSLLNERSQEVTWHLQMDSHTDHISIYADAMELSEELGVRFKVSILNDEYQTCVTKETFHYENGRCGFNTLVDWKYLHENPNLLTFDTLRLYCEITFSTGVVIREDFVHDVVPLYTNCPYIKSYQTLSKNILSLFINGNRSDIPFKIGGKSFALHKPILACRSNAFQSIIDINLRNFIVNDEMDSAAFEVMVRYLYSGVLCDMELNLALKVLSITWLFHITHLSKACSLVLQNLLTVDCVYTVLMETWDIPDNELKKALARFIYFHSNDIFARHEWRLFKERRPQSYELVMNAVNDVDAEQEAIVQDS